MPRIITIAEIKEQERARIAEATAKAAGKRANADQGSMAGNIEAGTNEAVATPDNWDKRNFATVVPAKHLPQQKLIRVVRDANGRETVTLG